jgi:glyoxylase-like metal-dependent hydrolase (beta-lactamase superfamily II)
VCAVVDPQGDPQTYVAQAQQNGMVVESVIDTHAHADHISCARELAALAGAPLNVGPGADVGFSHLTLADGQGLKIGNRRIRALHTPGHTGEHICLLVDEWFVLTGDTLFVGDVGRVDLALDSPPAGEIRNRAMQLHGSLQRLLALPDWTEIYPGHYAGSVCGRGMDGKPISTIGRERRANPALQLSEEAFVALQTQNLPPLPADFQAIKRHNLGK